MKASLYLFVFFLIGSSFSTKNHLIPNISQEYKLDGTWELISQYNYDGTHAIDTVLNTDGYRQIKMYNNGKVMWTRFVPEDSVEWFGYGSFYVNDSSLTETLEYGSASMMRIIDTMRVFTFELHLEKNHFKQITIDEEGNKIISENYKRID